MFVNLLKPSLIFSNLLLNDRLFLTFMIIALRYLNAVRQRNYNLTIYLLLDYLTNDPQSRDAETKKNCICNGPSCICCVDFNMSFIDLGGPGKTLNSVSLKQH